MQENNFHLLQTWSSWEEKLIFISLKNVMTNISLTLRTGLRTIEEKKKTKTKYENTAINFYVVNFSTKYDDKFLPSSPE